MAKRSDFRSVEEYLDSQPPQHRAVLEQVRAAIRKALPKAEEGISYQIPVYKIDGQMILYFAGFKEHVSLYPAGDAVEALPQLAPFRVSKGTLRFPLAERVPAKLIAAFAKHRAADASERAARKAPKKQPAAKKKAAPHKTVSKAASPKQRSR